MIQKTLIVCALAAAVPEAQGFRPIPPVVDPRATVAAKRLSAHTVFDSWYRKQRRLGCTRFVAALRAKGFSVAYTEVPGRMHGEPYWMQRLPLGIVSLTSGWK